MPITVNRANAATTTGVQSTAAAAAAKPFNARALRDAAYDAHTPVKNGEGYKNKEDLTSSKLSSMKQSFASWGHFEASRMQAVPQDGVTMRVVSFEYHSGKGMEAWLDAVPADKILELNVVTCVSGHDNLPHARFAAENVYIAEVKGPGGTVRTQPFGPGMTKQEEYASVSPLLTIDVSKPGDYVVTCAPRGSAGTGGYIEARKLTIHITGQEPSVDV